MRNVIDIIEQTKQWKEQIGATHLIVFAVDEGGKYLFGHQGNGGKPLLIKEVISAIKVVVNTYDESLNNKRPPEVTQDGRSLEVEQQKHVARFAAHNMDIEQRQPTPASRLSTVQAGKEVSPLNRTNF